MVEQEIWDLFDCNYQFKGTFIRGNGKIPPNLYHKTVEVIPTDMQGNLLITRRSMLKKTAAGQWEFPAGSVISGETEEQAAVRELKEETGLRPSKLYLLQKGRAPGIIRYTFLAYIPNLLSAKLHCDPAEVMESQIVDYNGWMNLLPTQEYNGFRTKFYNDKLFASMKKLVHHYAEEKTDTVAAPQPHKPLSKSSGLSAKYRHSQNSQCEENADTPPEIPDWEPSVEQGDDGT